MFVYCHGNLSCNKVTSVIKLHITGMLQNSDSKYHLKDLMIEKHRKKLSKMMIASGWHDYSLLYFGGVILGNLVSSLENEVNIFSELWNSDFSA